MIRLCLGYHHSTDQQACVCKSDGHCNRGYENKITDLNSQLKKYRSSTVTYTFGSETAVLDSDTITSWLKAEGETLTLDEEAIKAYISELANKYNTIYVPRTFHTSAGTDVTIEGNEYGYRIDQDGEYAQLLEDLKSGTAVTREPVYSKKDTRETEQTIWQAVT